MAAEDQHDRRRGVRRANERSRACANVYARGVTAANRCGAFRAIRAYSARFRSGRARRAAFADDSFSSARDQVTRR